MSSASSGRSRCRSAAARRARGRCRAACSLEDRLRTVACDRQRATRRPRRRTRAPTAPRPPSGRCRGRRRPGSRPAATRSSTTARPSSGGLASVRDRDAVGVESVGLRAAAAAGSRRRPGRRARRGRPMWKSAPSGPAISSAKNVPTRAAGDAAHDLADEVALGDGVVARRRARLPPRRLGGEQAGRLAPSRRGPSGASGSVQPGEAGGVAEQVADQDAAPCRRPRTRASSGRPARRRRARPGRPAPARTRRLIVLVVDQTLMIVSRSHGTCPAASTRAAPEVDDQSRRRS